MENPTGASEETAVKTAASKVFEYTGNFSLTLKGPVSGVTYFFSAPGERVEIAYEDSFGLMAERDLKPVRSSG